MKKIIAIVCILVMTFSLVACGEKAVQNTTEIEISKQSVKYREKLFGVNDFSKMTDKQILKNFNENYLPYLESRTKQEFPKIPTTATLKKESHDYGDVYTLTGKDQDKIVMYIHGGAWVWEISAEHVAFCDLLTETLGAKVYMPIYPLAPQANYEEGYAMIEKLYDELLEQDKPIIIMGDSAGATMTLGFVLDQKEKGKELPEQVIVMAPCADASFSNEDIADYQENDGMLAKAECAKCAKLWADGADLTDYRLSPLYGDYDDFPDTLMFIGDHDILYPDAIKLYETMCDANINASIVKGIGFWHVFPIFDIKERPQCLKLIKEFCEPKEEE